MCHDVVCCHKVRDSLGVFPKTPPLKCNQTLQPMSVDVPCVCSILVVKNSPHLTKSSSFPVHILLSDGITFVWSHLCIEVELKHG